MERAPSICSRLVHRNPAARAVPAAPGAALAQLCGRGLAAGSDQALCCRPNARPRRPPSLAARQRTGRGSGTCWVAAWAASQPSEAASRGPRLWAALPPCPLWPGLAGRGTRRQERRRPVHVTRPCDRPLGGHILSFWGGPARVHGQREGLAAGERGAWPRFTLGDSPRAGSAGRGWAVWAAVCSPAATGWQSAPSWALGSVHRRRRALPAVPAVPAASLAGAGCCVCVCTREGVYVCMCVRVPTARRLPALTLAGLPGHRVRGGCSGEPRGPTVLRPPSQQCQGSVS